MVHVGATQKSLSSPNLDQILENCLKAFVQAGTFDLSLDALALSAGISKRMLIHYFGGRAEIEERTMLILEGRLRSQFQPGAVPKGTTLPQLLNALWDRTTDPKSRGVLLLTMDLTKRAWSGSARAKKFYRDQQKLWIELLMSFSPDRYLVESALQLFQGALLTYLIIGDREAGRRALQNYFARQNENASLTGSPRRRQSTRSSPLQP
jgi:AcrR family transcriptional regulator